MKIIFLPHHYFINLRTQRLNYKNVILLFVFCIVMKFRFQAKGADWGCLRMGAEENILT
jgi:hypothetical protein